MKTQLVALTALLLGILSAQVEMNFSYEMKYGDGKQVTSSVSGSPDTTDYSYFENLLDINTYFGDNIYVYTQLEYSNPPVYGYNAASIDSMLTSYYMEYEHDRFNVKLGDMYELYGRGLSFYAFQDQNVDYDNSIKGISLKYFLGDNLKVASLIGTGSLAFRSNPTNRTPNYHFDTNVILGSIDYENNLFGYVQFLYLYQQKLLLPDAIKSIFDNRSAISGELSQSNRIPAGQMDYMTYGSYGGYEGVPDTLITNNYNLSWNYLIGNIDIYIDKAWIQYDKIYGEDVFGSRFYTSIYTELFGSGITYEYKNYFTPYLIKSLSNPPIVYREGNSILASRNVHSINFGNEIGHQIDINKNLFGTTNLALNLSVSHRHKMDDMESISLLDVLSMKDEDKMYDYYPFRQAYLELNGWVMSEQLYYKVGIDHFTEFFPDPDKKNTNAFTIPTHFVLKLPSGSSITMYLETQKKIVEGAIPGEYDDNYISLSYSHLGKLIITGFYDQEQEVNDSKIDKWMGIDLSYRLNTQTQVSLFYGSQKGGLVCANGICADQPGFADGYKVTFMSLF